MNNRLNLAVSISALIIAIVSLICVFNSTFSKDKVAYVDMQKVFHEFKGTLVYKKQLDALVTKQKSVLDSLRLEVMSLEQGGKNQQIKYEIKKEYYMKLYDEFSENQSAQTQAFDTKIWNQISGFVKTFGEEKGYKIIYGDKGDGVLLYMNPELEITKELIDYLNLKYEGE